MSRGQTLGNKKYVYSRLRSLFTDPCIKPQEFKSCYQLIPLGVQERGPIIHKMAPLGYGNQNADERINVRLKLQGSSNLLPDCRLNEQQSGTYWAEERCCARGKVSPPPALLAAVCAQADCGASESRLLPGAPRSYRSRPVKSTSPPLVRVALRH